jgi:hypothetical protein
MSSDVIKCQNKLFKRKCVIVRGKDDISKGIIWEVISVPEDIIVRIFEGTYYFVRYLSLITIFKVPDKYLIIPDVYE